MGRQRNDPQDGHLHSRENARRLRQFYAGNQLWSALSDKL